MKKIITIIFAASFFLNSCSLKPIISEKAYLSNTNENLIRIEDLGKGKILFYNYGYYCPVMSCGRITKMNVKANGKSLGQINYGEYFIVELEYGNYEFETIYKDVFIFKKKYQIVIDENTKVIKLKPEIFSKRLSVTNVLHPEINSLNHLTN